MSATLTAAAVYLALGANTLDREKFKAGSQPYTPSRVVSCPLNEYGRPSGCRVDTVGRFANPYAGKVVQGGITDTPKENGGISPPLSDL